MSEESRGFALLIDVGFVYKYPMACVYLITETWHAIEIRDPASQRPIVSFSSGEGKKGHCKKKRKKTQQMYVLVISACI